MQSVSFWLDVLGDWRVFDKELGLLGQCVLFKIVEFDLVKGFLFDFLHSLFVLEVDFVFNIVQILFVRGVVHNYFLDGNWHFVDVLLWDVVVVSLLWDFHELLLNGVKEFLVG